MNLAEIEERLASKFYGAEYARGDIEYLLGEVRRLQLWIASDVARARGLALALSEARDAEIPEQHQASREIAAEIVSLLDFEYTEEA